MFSTVNSALNDVPARYVEDRWETFQSDERYAHIVFNSPRDTAVGFGFVNERMEDLLTDSGLGQIWVTCEVTKEDRDLNGFIERMCTSRSAQHVTGTVNADSPFSLSAHHIRAGIMPRNTLLVKHPSEKKSYLQDLANRNVIEVVSAILWVRRRRPKARAPPITPVHPHEWPWRLNFRRCVRWLRENLEVRGVETGRWRR
jgi:hypothetical protein